MLRLCDAGGCVLRGLCDGPWMTRICSCLWQLRLLCVTPPGYHVRGMCTVVSHYILLCGVQAGYVRGMCTVSRMTYPGASGAVQARRCNRAWCACGMILCMCRLAVVGRVRDATRASAEPMHC